MQARIKVADHVIEVESVYRYFSLLSERFLTEEPPEVSIRIKQEDIEQGKETYSRKNPKINIPDKNVEVSAILRKVSEYLLKYNVVLMHGAAIALNNEAYIFTGRSGIGKTTHILKWIRNCPDAVVINGDKPFIKMSDQPMVYGSPWSGKEEMHSNTAVPLKAVILMERSERNHMEPVSFIEAFPFLLQQIYRPADENMARKTLQLMKQLYPAVSFWRFQCNNFREDCYDVAYNALVRGIE